MKIELASRELPTIEVDVLAVPATLGDLSKQKLIAPLDRALGGALLAQAGRADFQGKHEQLFELATLGRLGAARLLLVGVGSRRDFDHARLRSYAAVAARAATGANATSLGLVLPEQGQGAAAVRSAGEGLVLGAYRFTKYLTGERVPKSELSRALVIKTRGRPTAAEEGALTLGAQIAQAVGIARDAVNEPPNELTPDALARLAVSVAKRHKLGVTVLDRRGIESAGMKLCLAVAQGSANQPRVVHLTYKPPKAIERVVFVGKGLTFDAGGLCLKPAAGMGEMKCDMAGAAAVIGLMAAVALVRPRVEVHGLIGAVENMPDGAAYRPGDIFGSLDGKTVEIVNTDAEGRLVLADLLAYARRLEPDLVVDAATLTGACVVALGKTCTGYFTGDDRLARRLERAAREAGEPMWRLPLLGDLREQLKSDVADLKHTGERWGGAITAALFLREFVGKVPWIHCDIAGPALSDKASGVIPKGGTGHPVLTFLRLVENAAVRGT
jgi:leucyl aminopeptidase